MEITLDAHTAFAQAKAEGHAIRVWEDEVGMVLISPTVLSTLDTQEAHPSQEAHPPMQNFKRKRYCPQKRETHKQTVLPVSETTIEVRDAEERKVRAVSPTSRGSQKPITGCERHSLTFCCAMLLLNQIHIHAASTAGWWLPSWGSEALPRRSMKGWTT